MSVMAEMTEEEVLQAYKDVIKKAASVAYMLPQKSYKSSRLLFIHLNNHSYHVMY